MKKITHSILLILLLTLSSYSQDNLSFPKFELPDFTGTTHSSTEYKGKVVLIDFWATWCITCAKTIPTIQELYNKYSPLGLEVVGISIDTKTGRKMDSFLKKYNMSYPLLWDKENSLATQLKFESIPSIFLFDTEGKLIYAMRTVDEKSELELKETLKKLFKK